MIRIRASAISDLMADGKSADGLSAGAKTVLESMAKEMVYGYREEITSKYMTKGIDCEPASIALYNNVFFTAHEKNAERRTNDWITGEPDIIVPGVKIIDTKTSWSLPTFPATVETATAAAIKAGYNYQGAAYMWLFDIPEFEVAYCMVTTPEELRKYEQAAIHEVDHIHPQLRITRVTFKRDSAIEEKMKAKVIAGNAYLTKVINDIQLQHSQMVNA